MAKRGRPKKVVAELVEETPVATKELTVRQEQQTDIVPSAVDAQYLISRAIDKNLPIESMERLLAMRRELRAEWARDQFYTALSRFQKMCPIIGKEKGVFNKPEKGGALRYKYAPLDVIVEQVKDVLDECGFSYVTKTKQTKEDVTAIVEAHHRDGHTEVTEFTVPIDRESYMTAPQKIASALTYATRYAFRNAFGIMTGDEDDDANSAGDSGPKRNEPRRVSETKEAPVDAGRTGDQVYDVGGTSEPVQPSREGNGGGGGTDGVPSEGTDGIADAVSIFAAIIKKLNTSTLDPQKKIDIMKAARENRDNPVVLKGILDGF